MLDIPDGLRGRAFTIAEAVTAGLTRRALDGRRFVRIHHGVYRTADTEPTFHLLLDAARLVLPADAAVSHRTALRVFGLEIGPMLPLHFSTNQPSQIQREDVVVHRRQGLLHADDRDGRRVLSPVRTFIDVATQVGDQRLLGIGDWLVRECGVRPWELVELALTTHLDGVQRARRVAPYVRTAAASVTESQVRWLLVRSGLPEPELNVDIHDEHGAWLARGDLVYRSWKVLVEYDGWQHERDGQQRQWDHLRREGLEAAGWRVIVVTVVDLQRPSAVVVRVRQALRARGLAA
jgi:very-short-patch-repair endonuclease